MLQNAYLRAKIGADTAENDQHFAEILPIGRRASDRTALVPQGHRPAVPAAPSADSASAPMCANQPDAAGFAGH